MRELATLIELQSRIAERRSVRGEPGSGSRRCHQPRATPSPTLRNATFEPGFGCQGAGSGPRSANVGVYLATASRTSRSGSSGVGDRLDPRRPLLASVPDFSQEGLSTRMPAHAPRSASAEAFRFVVTSLETVTRHAEPLVLITSRHRSGKTVTTATRFAAAMAGYRALLIDADFGSQHLTKMLPSIVAGTVRASPMHSGMCSSTRRLRGSRPRRQRGST